MRYVSFLLVHINVTVQTNYDNYMFNNHLVKTTNFTAFTPPSLLQGKQEITFETLNTQYPSDQFILGEDKQYNKKKMAIMIWSRELKNKCMACVASHSSHLYNQILISFILRFFLECLVRIFTSQAET